jgi:hypothetical protein
MGKEIELGSTRSLQKLKARIIKVGANENNPRSKHGGSKMLCNGSSCSGGRKYFGR